MKTLFKKYTTPTQTENEEYIWVEGYKGMDKDMKCTVSVFRPFGSHSYHENITEQYHLGVETSLPEKETPETGAKGFHFCLTPEDTLLFYSFNFKNRYFKVRAYVNKKEYETEKENRLAFAAKKIIPYEEFFWSYEDIFSYYRPALELHHDNYEYLYTEEDFNNRYFKHKTASEIFSTHFFQKIRKYNCSQELINFIYAMHSSSPAKLMYYADLIAVLEAEEISKDTKVQILLNSVLDTAKLRNGGRR